MFICYFFILSVVCFSDNELLIESLITQKTDLITYLGENVEIQFSIKESSALW